MQKIQKPNVAYQKGFDDAVKIAKNIIDRWVGRDIQQSVLDALDNEIEQIKKENK